MTLESYLKTGQSQDSEQIVRGAFVHGPDHDDYITCMAPKPVLVDLVKPKARVLTITARTSKLTPPLGN